MEKESIVFIVSQSPGPFGPDFRIRRCLNIARRLQESHRVYFIGPQSIQGEIEASGGVFLESGLDDIRACARCLEGLSAKVAVFDLPKVPLEFMLLLRGLGTLVIAIDDESGLEDYVDIRINPTNLDTQADFQGLRYWVPDPKWVSNPTPDLPPTPAPIAFRVGGAAIEQLGEIQAIVRLLERHGYQAGVFVDAPDHGSESREHGDVIFEFKAGRRLLAHSTLIVNVGLPEVFDLLQLNRPVACIRQTEAEGELINQLSPEGGVFDLGILADARIEEICEHVVQIMKEPESLDYHRALASSTISQNNLEEVCDIINVVKILPWDSDFFGFTVAFLSSLKLNPAIARFVLEFCAKRKVRLIEYQCDCHDRESVLLAERHGLNFADIRLTFERFINGRIEPPRLPPGFVFDIAQEADIPALMGIADGLYVDSRYYFDTNFPRDRVHQFYKDWVRKAVLGTFDDCAMILRHKSQPIGFFTVKYEPNCSARIRLVGIDARYRSRGLALVHLWFCLRELVANGVKYVQVTTQGRNYAAQRLYQKAGFVTQKTELWYHKWFKSEELSYY